jgi:hypothetical protein
MIGEQALDRVQQHGCTIGALYRYLDVVLVCLDGLAGWIELDLGFA